jgi:hypothetical protein
LSANVTMQNLFALKGIPSIGGGGAGGGKDSGGNGGAGGAGGASVYIVCNNLVVITSNIVCNGANGANGAGGPSGGGGGGGGGGAIGLMYKTLVSGSLPTVQVLGGTGGSGFDSKAGDGANGYAILRKL